MAPRQAAGSGRREEILRCAVHVIATRGYADTRIAHVADCAGVSQALVIYYFQTRDRLLAEALELSEESFYSRASAELDAVERATDKLVRLLELCCAPGEPGSVEEPSWVLWLELWTVAVRSPEVARLRANLDARWRQTIAAIVRQGELSGEFKRVDVDEFTLRLAALTDGLAVQIVLGDSVVTPERMFEICMRMCALDLGFSVPRRRTRRRTARPQSAPSRVAASG